MELLRSASEGLCSQDLKTAKVAVNVCLNMLAQRPICDLEKQRIKKLNYANTIILGQILAPTCEPYSLGNY